VTRLGRLLRTALLLSLTPVAAAVQTANVLLTEGIRAYRDLEFAAAAQLLRRALEPTDSRGLPPADRLRALMYLGAAGIFREERDQAAATFRTLVLADPRFRPDSLVWCIFAFSPIKQEPRMAHRIQGVLSPVVTPFKRDLSPDPERYLRHCKWLLAHGCSGLAVFGTNSEANSLSVDERMLLLEALVQGGVPASKLMPGTGMCALTDTVRLTAHAVKLGCAGVLMLPPFYYKGVSDEGLYRSFAEVIERVGDARLQLYLYHIPPVAQVPISLALIGRLLKAYPGAVAGIKDSSGDWNNTKAVLGAYANSDFDVFAGSEVFLLDTMRAGGKGCITATGNVNPGPIHRVYENWQKPEADALQAGISATRAILQKYPMISALKAVVGHWGRDPDWATVRPPLVELSAGEQRTLVAELTAAGFDMPDLAAPAS